MTTADQQREILGVVVQGFPGAIDTLRALKATFPEDDYGKMVVWLAARGPRGPRLWERFHDRCQDDALILGHDILAQVGEMAGWQ